MKQIFRLCRGFTLFWTLFVGAGAVFGAAAMLIDPTGGILQMQPLLPYFQKMPFADVLFRDYTFSGLALLCVNGLTNLTAAALILRDRRAGYVMGWVFGLTLMAWIAIQFWLFAPMTPALDVIYMCFGFLQLLCGAMAWVGFCQRRFHFDPAEYPGVDPENRDCAVYYFSREGYTRRLAYEKAQELRCGVYELRTPEPTAGVGGFWWCGRFGLMRKPMALEPLAAAPEEFGRVWLFSPVWVFSLSAPARCFLQKHAGGVKSLSLCLVHFQNDPYSGLFKKLEAEFGVGFAQGRSVCVRRGRVKSDRTGTDGT